MWVMWRTDKRTDRQKSYINVEFGMAIRSYADVATPGRAIKWLSKCARVTRTVCPCICVCHFVAVCATALTSRFRHFDMADWQRWPDPMSTGDIAARPVCQSELTTGHILWSMTRLTHQWTDPREPRPPMTHDLRVTVTAYRLHTCCSNSWHAATHNWMKWRLTRLNGNERITLKVACFIRLMPKVIEIVF